MFKRIVSLIVLAVFLSTSVLTPRSSYAQEIVLPQPGTMVNLSPAYMPVLIKGLKVHPENPLLFDFILDTGKSGLQINSPEFKSESEKLIKYFLASLTIKEDDLWVNLSPYEKDRMITEDLGKTELGRDMLAQDYILKQLTASLIYPEKNLGKEFWNRVYAKAQEMYGTSQIPVNTFNKVWIVADKAKVLERNNTAYIVGAHLKVMLEEDYLAMQKHTVVRNDMHSIGANIIRSIIIPELEVEVNQGQNFAPLRQMFYSMILSTWYKRALKDALLNQVYSNKDKTSGVLSDDPTVKDKIYQQYLQAYKKGVFNYIKEDIDTASKQYIPRKYFSGGMAPGLGILQVLDEEHDALPQEIGSINTGTDDLAMATVRVDGQGDATAQTDYEVEFFPYPTDRKLLPEEEDLLRAALRNVHIVFDPVSASFPGLAFNSTDGNLQAFYDVLFSLSKKYHTLLHVATEKGSGLKYEPDSVILNEAKFEFHGPFRKLLKDQKIKSALKDALIAAEPCLDEHGEVYFRDSEKKTELYGLMQKFTGQPMKKVNVYIIDRPGLEQTVVFADHAWHYEPDLAMATVRVAGTFDLAQTSSIEELEQRLQNPLLGTEHTQPSVISLSSLLQDLGRGKSVSNNSVVVLNEQDMRMLDDPLLSSRLKDLLAWKFGTFGDTLLKLTDTERMTAYGLKDGAWFEKQFYTAGIADRTAGLSEKKGDGAWVNVQGPTGTTKDAMATATVYSRFSGPVYPENWSRILPNLRAMKIYDMPRTFAQFPDYFAEPIVPLTDLMTYLLETTAKENGINIPDEMREPAGSWILMWQEDTDEGRRRLHNLKMHEIFFNAKLKGHEADYRSEEIKQLILKKLGEQKIISMLGDNYESSPLWEVLLKTYYYRTHVLSAYFKGRTFSQGVDLLLKEIREVTNDPNTKIEDFCLVEPGLNPKDTRYLAKPVPALFLMGDKYMKDGQTTSLQGMAKWLSIWHKEMKTIYGSEVPTILPVYQLSDGAYQPILSNKELPDGQRMSSEAASTIMMLLTAPFILGDNNSQLKALIRESFITTSEHTSVPGDAAQASYKVEFLPFSPHLKLLPDEEELLRNALSKVQIIFKPESGRYAGLPFNSKFEKYKDLYSLLFYFSKKYHTVLHVQTITGENGADVPNLVIVNEAGFQFNPPFKGLPEDKKIDLKEAFIAAEPYLGEHGEVYLRNPEKRIELEELIKQYIGAPPGGIDVYSYSRLGDEKRTIIFGDNSRHFGPDMLDSQTDKPLGGIDLNAKNMSMTVAKDGQGVEMKFDPVMVVRFRRGNFSGVVPDIIDIMPITNIYSLLGLKEPGLKSLMTEKMAESGKIGHTFSI